MVSASAHNSAGSSCVLPVGSRLHYVAAQPAPHLFALISMSASMELARLVTGNLTFIGAATIAGGY